MTNSAKTPSGKARKGTVTVRPDSGSIKACFPRNYFDENKQLKLSTGINPNDWEAMAGKLQRRLQIELEDGKLATDDGTFNLGRYQEILEEYGLRAKLRVVKGSSDQPPPKPELSILEVWDMYCEYKRPKLAITTYELEYIKKFTKFIKESIESVGEDPLEIRKHLIQNRCLRTAKRILTELSNAYQFGIKRKLLKSNIFDGLNEDISERKDKEIKQDDYSEDTDLLSVERAFTWNEVETILNAFKYHEKPGIRHYFPFFKFKFLTGCRNGEAMGLWWCDVKWSAEKIIFSRAYSPEIKKFKPTKNETPRFFPMPKDGELWELLKSLPQGEPNELVFKSFQNRPLQKNTLFGAWNKAFYHSRNGKKHEHLGVVLKLYQDGKISKYLPLYNTRHTFINHQINDVGIPSHVVDAWCDHCEKVSVKHYRQIDSSLSPAYGIDKNQATTEQKSSPIESLEQQIKLLQQQLKQMKNQE